MSIPQLLAAGIVSTKTITGTNPCGVLRLHSVKSPSADHCIIRELMTSSVENEKQNRRCSQSNKENVQCQQLLFSGWTSAFTTGNTYLFAK
jgi:hypothetical protein